MRARSDAQVWLFPRRKLGEGATPSTEKGRAPLKVGIESIQPLFGLPQKDAAKALGISLTALKQVCRKLGVVRWPYWRKKKEKGKAAGPRAASVDAAQTRPLVGMPSGGDGSGFGAAAGGASGSTASRGPSGGQQPPREPDSCHSSSTSRAALPRTALPGTPGSTSPSHSTLPDARETDASAALVAVSAMSPRRAEGSGREGRGGRGGGAPASDGGPEAR